MAGEKKDTEMTDVNESGKEDKATKMTTEDLLRMSMDSISLLEGNKEEKKELTREEEHALVVSELKTNISLCEKTATTKEVRFILRALRRTTSLRKKQTKRILSEFVERYFPDSSPQKENLLNFIKEVTDEEDLEMVSDRPEPEIPSLALTEKAADSILPEVEMYLSLVVLMFLIDHRVYDLAIDCATSLTERLKVDALNIRTLDPLRAKIYFYLSRAFEFEHKLSDIRGELLKVYRTASLRHDDITQSTVLNLLLRNYLEYNLYDQANKLVSNVNELRDVASSSNQHARYLYYTGRIKAVQLDYTEAYKHLSQALRKAPQYSALGFRKTIQKLLIIVQLLMGDIPERQVFRQTGLKAALAPYFELTMAVRVADLAKFQEVVKTYRTVFISDKNYTLIQRIRKNVIKTGLRKINISYSKISLQDVCRKLHLDSVEDTEFIVAKAIRDQVIDATIDHENQFLKSKDTVDIYSTQEPLEAFHKRVNFCLNIHNDAVMAMRFPAKTYEQQLRDDFEAIEQMIAELEEEDEEEDF